LFEREIQFLTLYRVLCILLALSNEIRSEGKKCSDPFGFRKKMGLPIPGHHKKKVLGLERGPLSLVSTTEELLDRKIAAPV
jgi:hypothetical protein